MTPIDRQDRYCIVGAGSSGLVVARYLKQEGILCDIIEREDDVGGTWYYGKPHSSVCKSTHLISSKRLSEFFDFPMPDEYPDYPSHRLVWEYLRSYARHFGLYSLTEFERSIERIEPAPDLRGSAWDVTLSGGETRRYGGVVIANGHNWDPRYPDFPGRFDGITLHSGQYRTPEILRDKRVLVVGAGNSGCDIAVEAAQNAAITFHSMRRGYHYFPKYLWGMPADELNERFLRWGLPLWMRRLSVDILVKMVLGFPQDYGLPKPDHKVFETHPIVNSQMLYFVGHGEIRVKPNVAELRGDRVRFVDGTEELIDVLVYATGFKITFPFIDQQHLNWRDGRPDLYLNVFHPTYDNLFVAGLIQPDSGQFGLVDYQAQLIARFVATQRHAPQQAEEFRRRKATERPDLSSGIHYLDSKRHLVEVEHFTYRKRLKQDLARLA